METTPDGGSEGPEKAAITGRMVRCPRCGRAAGVPLPRESAVVDDADDADGTSPTRCPDCDTQFEVHYALRTGE